VITWKAFWSTLSVVLTAALTSLSQFGDWPGWMTVGVQAAAGAVFALVASVVINEAPVFAAVPPTGRTQMIHLIWVGAAAHLTWAIAFQVRPGMGGVWLLSLAVMGTVQYWVARGHEYLLTQIVRRPAPGARTAEGGEPDQYTKVIRAALDRAGLTWLTVLRWESIGAPTPFGVRVWVRMPSRMALTKSGERNRESALSNTSAEPIAIALAEVLRQEIMSDWVEIRKEPAAGTYTLLIVNQDVMGRIYPYQDPLTWSTVGAPKCVGFGMDGQPVTLRLHQHGQISGMSRWGKTSLVHVEWAELTLCADAIVWVGAVEKVYDLVAGWVEPYMDTDLQLPIDWIASGQADLLGMLVAAMTVARWRQRQPMNTRHGYITIVLYLDEASNALRNTKARAEYQGVAYTASQLVAMLSQGAGSANVHLRYISQRGVNSHFGDQGGDVTANAGFVAGFRTRDAADHGRLTGDYKLPNPGHPGEFWLEAGNGPVRVKSRYLQEVDPSKPVLHAGPTVSTVAWARRQFVRELDAGSARSAGDAYADRHTRMNAAMLSYLTDTEPADGIPAVEDSPGYQAALEELDRTGLGRPAGEVAEPDAPGHVPTMVGRRSHAVRIESIVQDAGALSLPDIVAALAADGGGAASYQVVTNALTKLVAEGRLHRPERGLYRHGRSLRRVNKYTFT
jgi:hypothetical protein